MSYFNYEYHITFFESIEKSGYFLMKLIGKKEAQTNYEKFTRTGRYDETGMEDPYGYHRLSVAKPFTIKLPTNSSRQCDLFLWYIQAKKVAEHNPIERAENWGWYKFSEEINIDKWMKDYDDYEKLKLQELQKPNGNGMQTTLF